MTRHHGDAGETSLFDGSRLKKNDARIEALGTVDELNSCLGLAATQSDMARDRDRLRWMQRRLLEVGADLANPAGGKRSVALGPEALPILDQWLNEYRTTLSPLRQFIIPGGTPAAASLHLARSVCRRAERSVWGVQSLQSSTESSVFLNRLSDVLFEMARWANASSGVSDPEWHGGSEDEAGPLE